MNFERLVRVVLIDAHPLFRDGLGVWFHEHDPFALVGEAGTAREGYEVIARETPDLVLTEIALPDIDGLTATREIRARHPEVGIIVLTGSERVDHVVRAFREGANGYVSKKQSGQELITAMSAVLQGEKYIAPSLSDFLAAMTPGKRGLLDTLTPREREIFDLIILERLSNRGIASRLAISIKTVETHREHINHKVGAHNTADLVRWAARNGLLDRDDDRATPELAGQGL